MAARVTRPSVVSSLLTTAISAVVCLAVVSAQSIGVRAERDAMHVQASMFSFIKGQPLARLKDGRSVRFDFELTVFAKPGGPTVAQSRESFVLSYDLWEERFAVRQLGPPPRSLSYLTARDAETWCLDRLSVPLTTLGRLGRDAPLWIRLEYRVAREEAPRSDDDTGLTLLGLVDRLSQRRTDELREVVDAGPLLLTN